MKIAYLTQHVDAVTGIGRVVRALASRMAARGNEVHGVSQSCDDTSLRWHKVASSHLTDGLDKLLYRIHEPLVSGRLHADIRHSMGVGRAAEIVSAQSCHKAGMELTAPGKGSRIHRRNWGLFDRLSLEDERRLITADSTRRIIAVSRLVRDQLLEYYPIPPEKITVIPNGIDTAIYSATAQGSGQDDLRKAMGIDRERYVLLFVGNEFERKGVQTIVEALSSLRDLPIMALLAGGDDSRPYQILADRLGVGSRVRFVGRVQRVEHLFSVADLFVFPTWYEPFGMVIAEAMAAGLPVITYRHAGAVEDMVDGRDALMLDDPRSPRELAVGIRKVVEDRDLASKLSRHGREAVKGLNWDVIADRFTEAYESVLDGSHHV